MLTSVKNPRIQQIRKLQNSVRARREAQRFVVEGVRLLEEALAANWQPEVLLFSEDLNERGLQLLDAYRAKGVEVQAVAPHVMQAASDTQTPQGILAVFPLPEAKLPTDPTFILVLDNLRDPGNLGTLLRTALAAGVQAVLCPPGGVDPFAPKVVRAAMGGHFKLPILTANWDVIEAHLRGCTVFLADSADGVPHFEAGFDVPLALIIGGESQGSGHQADQLQTQRVHIPMPGGSESLNAAVAGAILMFEVLRQRG